MYIYIYTHIETKYAVRFQEDGEFPWMVRSHVAAAATRPVAKARAPLVKP